MAKNTPERAPTIKKGEMHPASIIAGIDLYYPILINCNLDWSPEEGTENEKPARFYDSGIRIMDDLPKERTTIAICAFSAGQKIKDKISFEIRADYLIAVSHALSHDALSRPEKKKLLEESAAASAWPLFRALFAHLGSQTNLELPLLPNLPKLRWLKPGEHPNAKKNAKSA